ncbi:MAG: HNH endonuclease [Ferrovum myxofaciens]|uniref:HNH endonuclease n=1 Tax=Ferrovum myxofaciens TaxID=416213 RepID=UPI002354B49B|nr:HNH endonuclease [Ferrovum myxofaciens]QKE40296.1 MAG: HNH endonuclease [Ferrovum myxofaciens]
MAQRAPTPCRYPNCRKLVVKPGYCEQHLRQVRKQWDDRRGNASARGYGSRWQRARAVFLSYHPLCAECNRQGRVTPASVVDHIQPHRGNQESFWDTNNWQSLCKPCHDIKTVKEDGGFGRSPPPGTTSAQKTNR